MRSRNISIKQKQQVVHVQACGFICNGVLKIQNSKHSGRAHAVEGLRNVCAKIVTYFRCDERERREREREMRERERERERERYNEREGEGERDTAREIEREGERERYRELYNERDIQRGRERERERREREREREREEGSLLQVYGVHFHPFTHVVGSNQHMGHVFGVPYADSFNYALSTLSPQGIEFPQFLQLPHVSVTCV